MKNEKSDEIEKSKKDMKNFEHIQQEQFDRAKSDLVSNLNALILDNPLKFKLSQADLKNMPAGYFNDINNAIKKLLDLISTLDSTISTNYLKAITERVIIIENYVRTFSTTKDPNEYLENNRKAYIDLIDIYNGLLEHISIHKKFSKLTFESISNCITDVEKELTSFKRLRGIADTALTEEIYNTATQNFRNQAKINKVLFIGTLLLIAYIATVFEYPKDLTLGFWMPKITLSLIGITLVTYFLKQSSHYQKLADQSYQTQVELQALPSFIANISNHESAELIRKELALKYFGKDVDGTPHKDLSNLITDQMKSTTELVKATASMIKKQ